MAAVTIAAYALGRHWEGDELAKSLALGTLIGAHLMVSFVFRDERRAAFALPMNWSLVLAVAVSLALLALVYALSVIQEVFEVTALSATHAGAVLCLSLAPLLLAEAIKATGLLEHPYLLPEGDRAAPDER